MRHDLCSRSSANGAYPYDYKAVIVLFISVMNQGLHCYNQDIVLRSKLKQYPWTVLQEPTSCFSTTIGPNTHLAQKQGRGWRVLRNTTLPELLLHPLLLLYVFIFEPYWTKLITYETLIETLDTTQTLTRQHLIII